MGIERVTSAAPTILTPIVENKGAVKSLAASLFTRENAIFAAKIACGVVVAGGTMALAGYALESGGVALMSKGYQSLGSYMQIGGNGLFIAGKYTAYTVLVPTYMVCYQLPRWIITTGAPETARLFRTYVLEPSIEKIQWLSHKTVEVITYVHQHVVQPIVDKVSYVYSQYIVPAVTTAALWVQDKIVTVALWAKDKIVIVLEFTRDYILTPIANLAHSALELAKQYLFEPLFQAMQWVGNRIIDVIHLANEYILQPLFNLASRITEIVRDGIIWLGNNIQDYIFTPIAHLVQWIGNNARDYIITPLANLMRQVAELATTYFFEPIKAALSWTVNRVIDVLVFARDTLLPPLEQAANAVWDFAKDYCFYPVGIALQWAGNRVVDLLELGNTYVVTPMVNVAIAIGRLAAQAGGWVLNTVSSVATNASNLAQTAYTTARNDIYRFLGHQTV